jgi:hypothetical protein
MASIHTLAPYFINLKKMKKNILLAGMVLLFAHNLLSQKVEVKNDLIKIGGKDVFSYKDSKSAEEFTIYKLNTKDELIFIRHNNNGTPGQASNGDDYNNIYFTSLKLKMETRTWHLKWKTTVIWLYENGVLKDNGEIDKDKISLFIEKYNENISQK